MAVLNQPRLAPRPLKAQRVLSAVALLLAVAAAKGCGDDRNNTAIVDEPPAPSTDTPTLGVDPLPSFAVPTDARRVTVEDIIDRGPYVRCVDPPAAGTVTLLAAIDGFDQDIVTVATEEPCRTAVGLRSGTGPVTMLPLEPGGYYNASAVNHDGSLVIALTRLEVQDWVPRQRGMESNTVDPAIVGLSLAPDGTFSEPTVLADLDEAVWLGRLVSSGGELALTWWRDSLFEHMLFTPRGRPATDGLYRSRVTLDRTGAPSADAGEQIRDYRLLRPTQ